MPYSLRFRLTDLFLIQKTIFVSDPRAAIFNRTPLENAGILGVGRYGLLSERFFDDTITPVLGIIFSLKDLKRGPGKSGHLNQFMEKSHHGFQQKLYINAHGQVSPWPASLVVQYEA